MLQNVLKSGGAQKLNRAEQKNITGSTGVQPANCKCFCFTNAGVKVNASCFTYCANGSIPGLYPGSTGNCIFSGGL